MFNINRQQVRALAGVFQAAALVRELANEGRANPQALEASIRSVLVDRPANAEEVFGDSANLGLGLSALVEQLDSGQRDIDVLRYVLSLVKLERRLANRPDLIQRIREGVATAQRQSDVFPPLHAAILDGLGETYAATVSTLLPRVMVHGDPLHLNAQGAAARIRAVLLAGIRAATLWRQLGGSQWSLMLRRGRIVAWARALLREPPRRGDPA